MGESAASEIPAEAEAEATATAAAGLAAGSAMGAGLDLTAAEVTAEPMPPPTRWASPVEQWWHRWVLWATAPVAGLVIVAAVWSMLPSRSGPSAERPVADTSELPRQPQPAPPAPTTPEQPAPDPDRLDPRWLPERTSLVVSFRPAVFAGWADQQQIIESFGPSWERSVGRLVKGLGLKLGGIRRITWASTDLSQWPARSVVVVLLEQGHSTEPFTQLGKPAGFEFAGQPCRRIAGSGWEEPIAILDERLLLTGPEDLLKELARQAKQNAEGPQKVSLRSEAVSQLVVALPHDADLLCAADLTAAQQSGWQLPAALLDVWPDLAGPWQTVWQAAEGMGLAARWAGPMRLEAAVVCDSETTVEKVSDALGHLTTQAAEALNETADADSVAQRLSARGVHRQSIDAYARFLQVGRHALKHAQWETADRVVWLRLDLTSSAAEIAGLALAGRPGFRADWLLAARAADRARQQRLLGALTDYHHAHGRFPPGALGGAVLSPETRLSWIAAMLPYLGHEAWFDELKFGYPWNGPQNRAVTRRRLDAVINPALAQRHTEAGFPVTHYVGLAGLGADAARLPADDPRAGVFGFARSAALNEIPDGASNTIAIMGVSDRLGAWAAGGRPSVRSLTQAPYVNGPDGFGTGQPDGMLVGMADGSVRFISKDVDPRVIEMLATRAGGEQVPFEALAWDMGDENRAPPTQPDRSTPPPTPAVPLVPADRPPGQGQEQPSSAAGDTPQPELVPTRPLRPGTREGDGKQSAGGVQEADRPWQQPPAGPAPTPVDVAARLADKVPGIDFEDVPLGRAVSVLSQLSTVPVTFDPEALIAKEVTVSDPVTLHQENATVGEAFRAVCAQHGLACVVEEGQLIITTPAEYRQTLRTMRFTVSDLAGDDQAMLRLAEMIQMLVAPDSWRIQGGRGSLQVDGDALVVNQTMDVLHQVLCFCERLRTARGLPLRSRYDPQRFSLTTRRARGANVLDRTVTANFFHPAPLAEILAYLGQRAQIDILIDRAALAKAGLSDQRPARVTVDNRPLRVALDELLKPFGLDYRVIDEITLQVTTRKAIESRLELEFYPVAQLLADGTTPELLIDRLKAQCGGETWSDAGGAGRIVYDPPSGCLIVLQSQPVQADIERLLAEMTAAAQPAER